MEIERDDEDFSWDHIVEDAREYVEEAHGDEIARDAQLGTLRAAALDAHGETISLAEGEMAKARKRLADETWDEAIFHAARSIDGYAAAVFVKPFRSIALKTFLESLPDEKIVDTILKRTYGLQSGSGLVRVGLAAITDADETKRLVDMLKSYLNDKNQWAIRNATVHTLANPSEETARGFVDKSAALLDAISAPLKARTERAAARPTAKVRLT